MSAAGAVLEHARRAGWQIAPIWTIAKRVDRVGFPDAELLSVYRDWGVVRKSDREDNFNVEGDDLSSYKFVRPGDLVLNKMKTWQGSLAVSDYEGIVSPAYFTCELAPDVYPRFIHYLLRSDPYIAMYAAASKGIRPNQWDLPYDEFRAMPAVLPPLEEQRRIADFLDDQVARIDAIATARESQLYLLDEIRLGELEACVTHPPEVPSMRLNSLLRDKCVGVVVNPSNYFVDSGVPFVHGYNVRDGYFDLADLKQMSEADSMTLSRSRLQKGDVLVVRAGFPGRAAVVTDDLVGGNCASVLVLRASSTLMPEYLQAFFNSPSGRQQVNTFQNGAAQGVVNLGDVLGFRLQVPDLRTQYESVKRLEGALQQIQVVMSVLSRLREGLAEFKLALITAAVTGELDVTTARWGVPV